MSSAASSEAWSAGLEIYGKAKSSRKLRAEKTVKELRRFNAKGRGRKKKAPSTTKPAGEAPDTK